MFSLTCFLSGLYVRALVDMLHYALKFLKSERASRSLAKTGFLGGGFTQVKHHVTRKQGSFLRALSKWCPRGSQGDFQGHFGLPWASCWRPLGHFGVPVGSLQRPWVPFGIILGIFRDILVIPWGSNASSGCHLCAFGYFWIHVQGFLVDFLTNGVF